MEGDDTALDQCVKQLDKLIDVIDIQNFVEGEAVGRELVVLKGKADSETRPEITQICDIFRGKIIDVCTDSLIVEVPGNENKVGAFLELIAPFGIVEQARTGTVSLRRGKLEE